MTSLLSTCDRRGEARSIPSAMSNLHQITRLLFVSVWLATSSVNCVAALPVDTLKLYLSPEAYRAAVPDSAILCEKTPKLTVFYSKQAAKEVLRIRNGRNRHQINLTGDFLIVQKANQLKRLMPDGSLALMKQCDGLCLFQYMRASSNPLLYVLIPVELIWDEGKWWFSSSPEGAVKPMSRETLRESFADYPEFIAAVEKNFGKSELSLNARNLSRKKRGEYVLLQLFKKYVLK